MTLSRLNQLGLLTERRKSIFQMGVTSPLLPPRPCMTARPHAAGGVAGKRGGGVPGYLWAEKVSVPSTDCVLTRSTMVNTPWTAETCSSLPTCVLSQRRVAAWRQGAAGGADAAGGGQLVGAGHRRVCRFRLAWLHHRVPVLPCWLRGAPLACTHARPGCCSAGPRLHTDAQDPPCIALPVLRLPAVVMWVFSVCSCAQWPFRWMVWY